MCEKDGGKVLLLRRLRFQALRIFAADIEILSCLFLGYLDLWRSIYHTTRVFVHNLQGLSYSYQTSKRLNVALAKRVNRGTQSKQLLSDYLGKLH